MIESEPNLDIEKVLLHEEFSTAITHNSDVLFRRILKKEDDEQKQWLYKIFNYALFNGQPPKSYIDFDRKNQIKINATNFLADYYIRNKYFTTDIKDDSILNYKDIQKFFKITINKFISIENEFNQNPLFAGNFQRIMYKFLLTKILLDKNEIVERSVGGVETPRMAVRLGKNLYH